MDPQMAEEAETCLQRARDWLGGCQKLGVAEVREGGDRTEMILETAGETSIIMMGGSLRHDVYRRVRGSLPMRILERTPSSVLLVKRLPEGDPDFMKDPGVCG